MRLLPGPASRRSALVAGVLGLAPLLVTGGTASAGTLPVRPLVALAPPPTAPAAAVPALTEDEVAVLDPVAQGVLLAPLRRAAAALDAVGRGSAAAVYAGVALAPAAGRVDLLLTDPSAAPALLAAAARQDHGLPAVDVRVHPAAYALTTLVAASRRLVDGTEPDGGGAVDAAYPAPDGSGVVVEVADPVRAAEHAARRVVVDGPAGPTPVPVAYVAGSPRVARAWDAVKWHDSAPFIGGDVLTTDGHRYCTAGLPAVRVKDRHPVMVTADHCFGSGQKVYTGAGPTWAYQNGRTGAYVGTVTRQSAAWDGEVLDGATNDGDESDTSGWKPLTSVAYSYRGDYVCHAGARSAAQGHPTPCGIRVTVPDLYFHEGGHTVRGVEGVDVHGWGSVNGDSGGTVFAVEPHGARQLRGLVSTGGADGTKDQRRVDWPEAVDVFRAFGLELDPHR